jgi:hypothetical protein
MAIAASFICSVVLFISGFALSYSANESLESGIANGRWSYEELETLRANAESSLWVTLAWAFVSVSCILMTSGLFARGPYSALGWAALNISQSYLRLRRSVKQPLINDQRVDWRGGSNLHSEHWGKR